MSKVSRREMLKLVGMGAAGAILAACTPQATPQATSEPAKPENTVAPTEAPKEEVPTAAPASAEKVSLDVWGWGNDQFMKLRDQAVRSAYPDLDAKLGPTKFTVPGGGDFEVAEAFRLALASGQNIPDGIQFNRTQVPEFAISGVLTDQTETYNQTQAAVSKPYKEDIYAGVNDLVTYDGKYVGFALTLKSKVFHYRKDLFEQAGIDLASMDTMDGFLAAGKKFTEKFPDQYIMNLGPAPAQYWMVELLSSYEGCSMTDADHNYIITTHPSFKDMYTWMKTVLDSKIAFPVDDWAPDWAPAFADSTICGSLIASWMKFFLPEFAGPDQVGKWGTALWPKLSPMADQQYGWEGGGDVWCVPTSSKNVDLGTEYQTKMYLDKPGTLACFDIYGMTPLIQSARDDIMSKVMAAEKPADMAEADWLRQPTVFFGPEYQQIEFDSYNYVKGFPYDPSAAREVQILLDWLIKYMAGSVELDAALAGAQTDMETQIGDPYNI